MVVSSTMFGFGILFILGTNVSMAAGALTWTAPPPAFSPTDPSDVRTVETQVLNGSSNVALRWDYTLSGGETLQFTSWSISGISGEIAFLFPAPSTTIIDNRFSINGSEVATLVIKHVTINEDATYECIVTTNSPSRQWKYNIRVIVTVETQLISVNDSQTVCEGDNVTLLCDATGKPDPNVTWTRVWENGSDSEVLYTEKMFTLNNINRRADGTYRCTAYNGVGQSVNHTVDITVNFASSIEPMDVNQTVTEGVSKTFYCNAPGKPSPLVSWTKIGGGQVGIGHMLNFTSINRTDAGEYKCEATNECGNATAFTSIIVEYAPSILYISANKSIDENNGANLNCTADGIPAPDITWTRVSDNSPVSFNFTITGKQDEGYYRCTADNGVGTPASKDVYITVENYHPFDTQLHTNLQNDIVELHVMFNVTCSAEANPSANHRFYMGGESVFNDTSGAGVYTTHVSNRVKQVKYGCIPNNSYGDGPEKTIDVTVHYKPKEVTLTSNATVNSTCGDLWVTFNCTSYDANPNVSNYLLYEDNEKINSRRDGIWTTNVKKTGNRSYHCEANHTLGNERSINNFNLTVNSAPSIKPIDITEPVKEGGNVTLFCNASGSPDPSVNWTHVTSGRIKGGETWNIININRIDAGEYKCEAANECGNDMESVNVNVQFPPNITDPLTGPFGVRVGDPIDIECTADGNPPPSITWINATSGAVVRSGRIRSANPAKESDNGFNYTCAADNGIGPAASSNITLVVGDNITTIIIQLLESYHSEYKNVSNNESKQIILKIQNSLRLIPEINNTAVAIIVTKLSEGSVIAKVVLKFKEIVHIGSMISAIRAAAENGSIGNLEVNATSVRIFQEPKSTSSPTTTPTTTSTTAPKTTPKEGTSDFPWWILGVAVGGVILLAILIAIVAWCIHKKRKCRRKDTRVHSENEAQPLEEFSNGTPNGENAENNYAQVNHGYAKSGPAPTNENNQGAAGASAVPPVTYAVVDKSKKNEKPPEYAAVDKSKKKKKKSAANEEKPPEDQYAVVNKSQKKKKPEEPEQQYAQVDRSMKKKHAKPGEVLYADLGEFHGNNSLPKVSTSPEPLPPIKKPTAYVDTQYADITQFLKGDATLPSSDGTGGVTPAAQGQPTAGAQVGTGGAAATSPGEEAGGGSSHVSKL